MSLTDSIRDLAQYIGSTMASLRSDVASKPSTDYVDAKVGNSAIKRRSLISYRDMSNLAEDGSFEDPGYRAAYPLTAPFSYIVNEGTARSGAYCVNFNTVGAEHYSNTVIGPDLDVVPGEQFYVSWWMYRDGANISAGVFFEMYNIPGGLWPNVPALGTIPDKTWVQYSDIVTVPSGSIAVVSRMSPRLGARTANTGATGLWRFDDVVIRRVTPRAQMATDVRASLLKADNAYQKPSGGIGAGDMSSDVNQSLSRAESAYSGLASKADLVNGIVPYSQLPVIDKGTVGLGNVDNTSDAAKPLSAAAQAESKALRVADGMNKRASAFAADKVSAAGASRANYEDATQFADNFAGLTNWAYTSGKVQVSSNRLYGAAGGTAAGMNRSFPIGITGSKGVFKAVVNIVGDPGAGGDIIIGFTNDTAGAVPAATGASARGINFQPGDGTIRLWNLGRDSTSPTLGTFAAGTYYVTVTTHSTVITVGVTNADGTYSANRTISRSGWTVNNLFIFINDPRGTSGSYITNVGATSTIGSVANRSVVEDKAPFWSHIATTSGGSYMVRIAFPKAYDSRRPGPMIFMFHGHGGTPDRYGNSADGYYAAAKAYVDAGFIVVSAGYLPNTMTWGAEDSLLAYEWAYRYVCSYVAFTNVIFHANSMGGIESLLTIARGVIPCEGWIATVPTANLRANYDDNFKSSIVTAYGIAADGSDYSAKTEGHDPMLLDPSFMAGIPAYVMVATDDTTVYPSRNWNALEPRVLPYLRSYTRVDVTGGHTSGQLNANSATMATFARSLISNTPVV